MSGPQARTPDTPGSWDAYWRGSGTAGAFSAGGVSHPAIKAFWEEFFRNVALESSARRMLDIASGAGAVVEQALAADSEIELEITCVDISESAVENIRQRFPSVTALVADARSIPLESEYFDLITSQFGVEYAGTDAIEEAARLLAVDGRMALLLHNSAGSIHRECEAALDAIERLRASEFIPRAMEMFRTGFAALRGADRSPYDEAAKQLAPAVKALEDIMTLYGPQVAGDLIVRLYEDVGRIHQSMPNHDPEETLQWLQRMDGELDAYAGRMASMRDSALDEDAFQTVCDGLRARGFAITDAGPFSAPGEPLPLAWALLAQRRKLEGKLRSLHEIPDLQDREQLTEWIRQQMQQAVEDASKSGLFDSLLLEARPAWVFPFQIVIAQVREKDRPREFYWLISGEDLDSDMAHGSKCASPREAARHFALSWQLKAARTGEEELAERAEALYELVADDRFWKERGQSS